MKKMKKITLSILLFCLVMASASGALMPRQAHAQWATFDALTESSTWGTFASNVENTVMSNLMQVKEFILDGLAWALAKALVQAMVASTVNWINSGFQGSPSFLTNPGGYFADAADQVTGAFIANTGVLSSLCSPFNVDVRLALALNQAGYTKAGEYTCTISSIFNNVKNSTIDGASIQGFMNGDYAQGGMPAFIALGEPQNNASGAFLQAQSDIGIQINSRQGSINQQLLQGNGFLSFQKCTDISQDAAATAVQNSGNANAANQFAVQNATAQAEAVSSAVYQMQTGESPAAKAQKFQIATGNGTSIQSNIDPNTGAISYKNCETETPGSVISGTINKSLGIQGDSLVTADEIDEVIGALMNQLVQTVLTSGLHGSSNKSSGQTQSFIDQLAAEQQPGLGDISGKLITEARNEVAQTTDYKNIRDQILTLYTNLKILYMSIEHQCTNSTDIQTTLQNTIDGKITDLVNQAQQDSQTAQNDLNVLNAVITAASSTDAVALSNASQKFAAMLQSNQTITAVDVKNAQTDLDSAQKTAASLRRTALNYQNMCLMASSGSGSNTFPVISGTPQITNVDTTNGVITGTNLDYATDVYSIADSSKLQTEILYNIISSTTISIDLSQSNVPLGQSSLYVSNPNGTSKAFPITIFSTDNSTSNTSGNGSI